MIVCVRGCGVLCRSWVCLALNVFVFSYGIKKIVSTLCLNGWETAMVSERVSVCINQKSLCVGGCGTGPINACDDHTLRHLFCSLQQLHHSYVACCAAPSADWTLWARLGPCVQMRLHKRSKVGSAVVRALVWTSPFVVILCAWGVAAACQWCVLA